MPRHSHPLTPTTHRGSKKCDGNFSAGCRFKGVTIPSNTTCYYCYQCNYNLCVNCYATEYIGSSAPITYRSKHHIHALQTVASSGWKCDRCRKDFKYSTQHYRCNQCDYDECSNCFDSSRIPTALPHAHPMTYTSVSANWVCDGQHLPEGCISVEKGKTEAQIKFDPRYRCSTCDYDLCVPCYNFYMLLYVNGRHPHALKLDNCDNGWMCNGKYSAAGCRSNLISFNQSHGKARYRCDACDFDLCGECYVAIQGGVINNNNNNSSLIHPAVAPSPVPIPSPVVVTPPVISQPHVTPAVAATPADGEECIVCMDAKKVITFVHANTQVGHTCCCESCAAKVTKCPICNLPFDMKIKSFVC